MGVIRTDAKGKRYRKEGRSSLCTRRFQAARPLQGTQLAIEAIKASVPMQLIRSLAACLLLLTTGTVPALAQDAASLIALSERLQGEAEARGDMLEAGSTIAA
ncbi:MAG TPA: hypothetical protein DF715_04740, partial [Oceanicaulis sp.]|nr:hypothetical protein [Oceanicaulis sp.]